jgi:hypothetical protein
MELNAGGYRKGDARGEKVESIPRHDGNGRDTGRGYLGHVASHGRGFPAHPSGVPHFQEFADRRLHDLDPH